MAESVEGIRIKRCVQFNVMLAPLDYVCKIHGKMFKDTLFAKFCTI